MAEKKKKISIENNIEKLEEILEKMEDRDIPLDDAFALYEKGIKLLKETNDRLDTIEKNVMSISDNGKLSEFEEDDGNN